ncbi:DNA methyltransferase [Mycobacterium avium 10-5581]|nr:DNA methyltransferase [Mycobacterium avium 10-5581]
MAFGGDQVLSLTFRRGTASDARRPPEGRGPAHPTRPFDWPDEPSPTMTAPPMAYYGGKQSVAKQLAALLPAHQHYVEPFAGSLAVLLAKHPSRMETVNDLDGHLIAFWRVLRDRASELIRVCALTPHSRAELASSHAGELEDLDELERARRTWVRITQGRSGTLRKTGWRYHVDPGGTSVGMPGYLEAYVARMTAAAHRLHHVSLECRHAFEVIDAYGAHEAICLYVDPPYLGSTRCRNYRVEMTTEAEHADLLEHLLAARAAVVISGYASTLYDTALGDWDRLEIPSATTQGGKSTARTEIVWSNRAISAPTLFDLPTAP